MSEHKIQIKQIDQVTHDVLSFTTEKPEGYQFKPGQATEMSIAKENWKEEKRPFTFTGLPEEEYLEFTIKTYPSHDGVTEKMRGLKEEDELMIGDPWGAIEYKGEGVFIAGGAGVTPFIAILKDLGKKGAIGDNKLIFANKASKDIILKDEFGKMLGANFINILSDERTDNYSYGQINKEFLEAYIDNFGKNFYVCGPPSFNEDMLKYLEELGANPDALVFEK